MSSAYINSCPWSSLTTRVTAAMASSKHSYERSTGSEDNGEPVRVTLVAAPDNAVESRYMPSATYRRPRTPRLGSDASGHRSAIETHSDAELSAISTRRGLSPAPKRWRSRGGRAQIILAVALVAYAAYNSMDMWTQTPDGYIQAASVGFLALIMGEIVAASRRYRATGVWPSGRQTP